MQGIERATPCFCCWSIVCCMAANTFNPRARALAGALRQARESRVPKVGLNAHARKLGISPSVVSYWETGRRVPSTEDVASFLTALDITGEQRENILDLASGACEPDWLGVGISGGSQQLAGLLELERTAEALTTWTFVIPGICQTSEYAREILGHSAEAEGRIRLRLSRRDALIRRNPLRYTALVSEVAIRQVIGGRAVMADQLRYLLEIAERDNVTLQVVPIGEGWHPGLVGGFVLYDFLAAPSIVHLEHHRSAAFVYNPDNVASFKGAVDSLREVAMSPADSAEFVTKFIVEYNRE